MGAASSQSVPLLGTEEPLASFAVVPKKTKKVAAQVAVSAPKASGPGPLRSVLKEICMTNDHVRLGLDIYRFLGRGIFRTMPSLAVAGVLWAGLIYIAFCIFHPRLAAKTVAMLASAFPALMGHILTEFADEFVGQLFGTPLAHCPESCYADETPAPDLEQARVQGFPTRRPPAQPPSSWVTCGIAMATSTVVLVASRLRLAPIT